jgi:YegS/Rv2252/BmrU family lipid kinase
LKVFIVYNPRAANGKAKKLLQKIEDYLKDKNYDYDLQLTEYPHHAKEMVRNTDFLKYDGIIAAGGDGTLFDVINGYYQNSSYKKIPIGVLPVGTGNAFIRDMDLDNTQWRESLDIIYKNNPKKVDVGKFILDTKDYYFLNILGLGFVSDVGETAHKLKFLGNLSYTIGVLYQLATLSSYNLNIEIDGKLYERENLFVEISNTRYTSNFLMAPNAENDDGLLDVTLLTNITRRKLLKFFPKVFTGEHVNVDEIETFRAKKIKISTDVKKILTPDGELFGSTPVEIECLHQTVDVFWK